MRFFVRTALILLTTPGRCCLDFPTLLLAVLLAIEKERSYMKSDLFLLDCGGLTMTSQSCGDREEKMRSVTIRGTPGPFDVLMGRGAPVSEHTGNARLRQLVMDRHADYVAPRQKRNDKHRVALNIIQVIREKGGRFLRRAEKAEQEQQREIAASIATTLQSTPAWEVVTDEREIVRKVKQLLRDMGPEAREKRAERHRQRCKKPTPEGQQHQRDARSSLNMAAHKGGTSERLHSSMSLPPSGSPPMFGNSPSRATQRQLFSFPSDEVSTMDDRRIGTAPNTSFQGGLDALQRAPNRLDPSAEHLLAALIAQTTNNTATSAQNSPSLVQPGPPSRRRDAASLNPPAAAAASAATPAASPNPFAAVQFQSGLPQPTSANSLASLLLFQHHQQRQQQQNQGAAAVDPSHLEVDPRCLVSADMRLLDQTAVARELLRRQLALTASSPSSLHSSTTHMNIQELLLRSLQRQEQQQQQSSRERNPEDTPGYDRYHQRPR